MRDASATLPCFLEGSLCLCTDPTSSRPIARLFKSGLICHPRRANSAKQGLRVWFIALSNVAKLQTTPTAFIHEQVPEAYSRPLQVVLQLMALLIRGANLHIVQSTRSQSRNRFHAGRLEAERDMQVTKHPRQILQLSAPIG